MPGITLDQLPSPVSAYLKTPSDLAPFTTDATVVDEDRTHTGIEAVTAWATRTSGEFTYTTTPLSAERTGKNAYTVTQHLEGDFPGGEVDLHFRFTLRGDLIAHLVIEP